ncbi:MAG TPA: hypothetical protein VNB68_01645, partial [Nitrososphaeraceae archaeon]|nr:hypothetical protein [Nitrososphaeraceae archaeon]
AVYHHELVYGRILVAILVKEEDLVMEMRDAFHMCYNYSNPSQNYDYCYKFHGNKQDRLHY